MVIADMASQVANKRSACWEDNFSRHFEIFFLYIAINALHAGKTILADILNYFSYFFFFTRKLTFCNLTQIASGKDDILTCFAYEPRK